MVRINVVTSVVLWTILAGPARGQFSAFLVEEIGGAQHNPDVSGTVVVWMEFINGDYAVRGTDLLTADSFMVTQGEGTALDPVIDGNTVVWRDRRSGDFELYAYDVLTRDERPVVHEIHIRGRPAFAGDSVVWADGRNSPPRVPPEFGNLDIYAVDLRTGDEFLVAGSLWNQQNPAVSGDIIVWQDSRRANPMFKPLTSDIYGYDVTTGRDFLIAWAADNVPQVKPDISGNIVVWQDMHNGGDIRGYDLATDTHFPIHVGPSSQGDVAIDGRYVVWEDGRNATNDNNFDIYGYDLLTGQEFPICVAPGKQSDPRISGNLVVWDHRVPGELDRIYGAYIPEPACAVLLLAGGAVLFGRRARRGG